MLLDTSSQETPVSRLDAGRLAAYYQEVRRLARRALRRDARQITLQPTELAHEAAIRLLGGSGTTVNDEAHLLALSAKVIRATLIDEVRRRRAAKRDVAVVTRWTDRHDVPAEIDIEDMDRLLDELARIDPLAADVVQLRFFVGLSMTEIASALGISESTALRRWRIARAWLFDQLASG